MECGNLITVHLKKEYLGAEIKMLAFSIEITCFFFQHAD